MLCICDSVADSFAHSLLTASTPAWKDATSFPRGWVCFHEIHNSSICILPSSTKTTLNLKILTYSSEYLHSGVAKSLHLVDFKSNYTAQRPALLPARNTSRDETLLLRLDSYRNPSSTIPKLAKSCCSKGRIKSQWTAVAYPTINSTNAPSPCWRNRESAADQRPAPATRKYRGHR